MAFWRKKTDPGSQPPESPPAQVTREASGNEGLLSRLRSGLTKTRRVLGTDIRDLFKAEGRLVDTELLDEIFTRLVRTDMGAGPASEIRDQIAHDFRGRKVHLEEILKLISDQLLAMLRQETAGVRYAAAGPTVILVVGVNGSGKTTSIAKLAAKLTRDGKKVVLGAGDTFRAAAVEQLTIWSDRIGCTIVKGKAGGDPASVAYTTAEKAVAEQFDVAIIDTAGRLQNQTHLMQQLDKLRRVISKPVPDAPHEVLLVLDATAGQNAISQARGFSEAAGCTGIILAKLDGSAKGGVIIPILRQFKLPVKFVGVGEGLTDLLEFDADLFVSALLSDS
jgi:fused signal recognition particle receptor